MIGVVVALTMLLSQAGAEVSEAKTNSEIRRFADDYVSAFANRDRYETLFEQGKDFLDISGEQMQDWSEH